MFSVTLVMKEREGDPWKNPRYSVSDSDCDVMGMGPSVDLW